MPIGKYVLDYAFDPARMHTNTSKDAHISANEIEQLEYESASSASPRSSSCSLFDDPYDGGDEQDSPGPNRGRKKRKLDEQDQSVSEMTSRPSKRARFARNKKLANDVSASFSGNDTTLVASTSIPTTDVKILDLAALQKGGGQSNQATKLMKLKTNLNDPLTRWWNEVKSRKRVAGIPSDQASPITISLKDLQSATEDTIMPNWVFHDGKAFSGRVLRCANIFASEG